MGGIVKKFRSLNLFWRINLAVLLFLLAIAPISYMLDDQLFMLINQNAEHSCLDRVALFAGHHGFTIQFISMAVPLAFLYAFGTAGKNSMKKGILMLLAAALAFLFFYSLFHQAMDVIKETVQRPRPYLELEARVISPMSAVLDYRSFPSRHAGSSFYIFCVTIYFLHKSSESMKLPKYLIAGVAVSSCGLALARAISRTYLGYHYPSDIVCGAIFGLLFAMISVTCIEWVRRKRMWQSDSRLLC